MHTNSSTIHDAHTINEALADAIAAGKVKPGMLVLLVAFGVGLSWGAVAIRWPAEA